LVICPDPGLAAELAGLLARQLPGVTPTQLKSYPSASVLTQTVHNAGLRLCFLDVGTNREVAFQLLGELSALTSDAVIVALLEGNDPDLILRCLRQGATDFLVRPFTPDQLETVLQKLARSRVPARTEKGSHGRIYCVVPAKGGSGATTLAANLAFHLRRSCQEKILLADMDPVAGTLAFQLKLKSNHSFLDALTRIGSLDADLWKAVVTPCQGVDVLLSPENPVDAAAEAGDPSLLLRYCRQWYQTIIVDTGGAYGEWNLALADQADEVLVVTSNELAALHATQRVMAYLEASGLSRARNRLVLARYRPDAGLPQPEVETAVRQEVFHVLPSDPESIHKSLLEGKPAAEGSRYARSVAALAARLGGEKGPARKAALGGLLSGLLR
jgi:pilus assembly protein CpaE